MLCVHLLSLIELIIFNVKIFKLIKALNSERNYNRRGWVIEKDDCEILCYSKKEKKECECALSTF